MKIRILALSAVLIAAAGVGTMAITPAMSATSPAYREVVIPAGTTLSVSLDSYVASDSSRVEDRVRAKLRRPIVIRGMTAVPAGSALVGHVTRAERSGRVKGRGLVAFRFDRLATATNSVAISTSSVARRARSGKNRDVKTIALPTAGGAIVGAVAGGKKGAAIGAATGAGAGTGVVLATRGPEVRLGRGAIATVRLLKPITVRVKD